MCSGQKLFPAGIAKNKARWQKSIFGQVINSWRCEVAVGYRAARLGSMPQLVADLCHMTFES
jgi:hypothetical protein